MLRTDGPFAETKEFVGGFDVLECDSLDEAVAVAARYP
ncbi:YciI family protein [Streptomyces sp. NPDC002838]